MMNQSLSDRERVAVAKLEYQLLEVGDPVIINQRLFGRVIKHVYKDDGFQMFVIKNLPQNEYTLLFKGSSGVSNGNPETWMNEWVATNLPIGRSLLFSRKDVPSQPYSAVHELNTLLRNHPHGKFFIYGHSLKAINIQFALAYCHHIGRIKRVYMYEGPNMYWLMRRKEIYHVRKFKHKVANYIDNYDPVALGYVDHHQLVGQLHYIDSKRVAPVTQHMWGGYQFTDSGHLLEKPLDDRFKKRAEIERKWIQTGSAFYSRVVTIQDFAQSFDMKRFITNGLDDVKRGAAEALPFHEGKQKV